MMDKVTDMSYHVCGFNGFGQIDQFVAGVCTSSGEMKGYSQDDGFYSIPQTVCKESMCIQKCKFSWSDIWITSDVNKIKCFGFNKSQVFETVDTKVDGIRDVVLIGQNTIIQTNQETILVDDHGNFKDLPCETDGVDMLAATNEAVLGIKDEGTLYEGFVRVDGDAVRLVLHPLPAPLAVAMVSCGFEHSLILTKHGTVFSYGKGSRGQLGHGDMSVDILDSPTLVSTLDGVHVATIATGGWHSTAVTDSGDLYVWGWNQSGQLGLPNKPASTEEQCTSAGNKVGSPFACNIPDNCNFHHANSSSEKGESDNLSEHCLRLLSDLDAKRNPQEDSEIITDSLCRKRKLSGSSENELLKEIDSSNVQPMHDRDCNKKNKRLSKNIPLILHQVVDPVQVQTVPYGLDIPDECVVTEVACGSRHTCVLLDSGHLMTTGWNDYGQLGHGDTCSRDYLQSVLYFVDRGEIVVDVQAGGWNMFITAEKGS